MTKSVTEGDVKEQTSIKHYRQQVSGKKKHCKKATSKLKGDFWTTEDRKSSLQVKNDLSLTFKLQMLKVSNSKLTQ